MAGLHFDESLVAILDGEELDTYSVEERLARILMDGGWVKETYPAAVHEREKVFPTALDVNGINVAIPHCDVEHVEKGALCVGVLKRPVSWRCMDDAAKSCDVSLVVMLALNEPHAHLEMLQKVIALIQDQELVSKVISAKDAHEAFALLGEKLA